jgi:hypothetical protein
MDLITRFVDGYGWLPIITFDGKEIYRGEFKPTAQEAFDKCCDFAAKYKNL